MINKIPTPTPIYFSHISLSGTLYLPGSFKYYKLFLNLRCP